MKRLYLFILFSILLQACTNRYTTGEKITLNLTGNWEFREAGKDTWYPATVPGTVHTDLMDNGLIEDPFYRLNESGVQWVDKAGWEYRCFFEAGSSKDQEINHELVFDGLDTYAEIYLNDSLILETDNMFRTYRVNCNRFLNPGENELRILFKSPVMTGLKKMEAYGLALPAGNDQSERGGMGNKRVSPFVRKAPYHFGWDWGPRLVTSGIWRPVRLESWASSRIENIYIITDTVNGEEAGITAWLTIVAGQNHKEQVRIYVDNKLVADEKILLKAGVNRQPVPFRIAEPLLWWPNGMGGRKLYDIRVETGPEGSPDDHAGTSFGIREIQLIREPDPDKTGESFYFRVNGRPVFAKGANYIPNDVFLTRVSPDDYEFIIQSAAGANMNMLRVWGGGIYEEDLFYELCDRYGIMVWQDFMFACSMYPGDEAFLESVRKEAEDNVTRLRNHPCLALWCGNNEIEIAWAEWEENRGWGWKQQYDSIQRKQVWKAYDTLFHQILKEVVEDFNPAVPYWHSSPSAGPGKLAGYESTSGDMHYWGVWHGLDPLDDFRKYRARFMSEYGFQSFPEFSSVKRYTIKEDWDIESPVMTSHQRSGIGNLRIRQYMEADYRIPVDFERFLHTGQVLQAEAIKLAIESHRADMPYCMGTLYWQLNDCWPVASWSGIDYYKKWKALHYFVKDAFKPVIVVTVPEKDSLVFRIISDESSDAPGELQVQLIGFDGKLYFKESTPVRIHGNASSMVFDRSIDTLLGTADPAAVVLVTDLVSEGQQVDRSLYYFVSPKDMKLQDPGLETRISESGNEITIHISAKQLAKNVFLALDGYEGQFPDNYFDLLPGEVKEMTIPKNGHSWPDPNKLHIICLE